MLPDVCRKGCTQYHTITSELKCQYFSIQDRKKKNPFETNLVDIAQCYSREIYFTKWGCSRLNRCLNSGIKVLPGIAHNKLYPYDVDSCKDQDPKDTVEPVQGPICEIPPSV